MRHCKLDIEALIQQTEHPKPYDRGKDSMWTDPYISEKLLAIHLDPSVEAASRSPKAIEATLDYIQKLVPRGASILDLGCGPGLYTHQLAKRGYEVTGVDFSSVSLDYARQRRDEEGLCITYLKQDYRSLKLDQTYDLIMMIYCDFGALVPEEQHHLASLIKQHLKEGGLFLFDSITEVGIKQMYFNVSYSFSKGEGFYSPEPYLCLDRNFHFPDQCAVLEQHFIIFEDGETKLYRFWNHYFSNDQIKALGFSRISRQAGLLYGHGPYNNEEVVFYAVQP